MLYDSMHSHCLLSPSLQCEVAAIDRLPVGEPHVRVQLVAVQQQRGRADCGLFAIAFAVELAHGNNPEYTSYDQKQMREHLIQCFEIES